MAGLYISSVVGCHVAHHKQTGTLCTAAPDRLICFLFILFLYDTVQVTMHLHCFSLQVSFILQHWEAVHDISDTVL